MSDKESTDLRVQSRAEILALLQELHQRQTPIQISTPAGEHVRTLLWAVDAERDTLSLEADPAQDLTRALQSSDELSAVAYLDSIRLQFELSHLVLVTGSTEAAWTAPLPVHMYRFQRREAFRVQPLGSTHPVVCIPGSSTEAPDWRLRVLDISAGGVGLLLPDTGPGLALGDDLPQCVLELDRNTRFKLKLRVQYLGPVAAPHQGRHLGCAFVDLGGEALRELQLFIDNTQRKRRLFKKA